MIFNGSDSDIRHFYHLACVAIAVFCVFTYAVQWFLARRAAASGKDVDTALAWKLWSLRTVKSFFYGAGIMFMITPFGYLLVQGPHGFNDCAAFTMPCLAGVVVGLALLEKQYPIPKARQKNATAHPQIAPPDAADPVQEAGNGDGDKILELHYYIASVLIIIAGYIAYIGAHPSDAIEVFVILGFGWFALGWLAFIWVERIRNGRKEDFCGFFLLLVLIIGLGSLSCAAKTRWDRLLPRPCDQRENNDCQVEHCAEKKTENHVIPSTPLSTSGTGVGSKGG